VKTLLLILLLLAAPALAEVEISPARVRDGESFLLHLKDADAVFAVTRWNDAPAYFDLQSAEPRLLLAVKSGQRPGRYPLTVNVLNRAGETIRYHVDLQVVAAQRPVERLTLPPGMVNPRLPEVLERIEKDSSRLQVIYRRNTPSRFWDGFNRPVNDPVGSVFGLRRILNGQPKSPHSGVDFRSPRGRRVLAPAAGTVQLSDDLFYTGNTVVIDHGGGLVSVLAHMQSLLVKEGTTLTAGQPVGSVGSTGRSTGPHLHWTVRLGGVRTDPLALIRLLAGQSP